MRIFLTLVATAFFLAQVPATERLQAAIPSVDVPAGEHLVLKAHGEGFQVYRCDRKGDTAAWVFLAPEAKLSVKGADEGSHAAGPVWHDKDGSSVWGEVVAKAPSPSLDSIPLLLLKATRHEGTGILANVNYIQRMDTRGGDLPPGDGCVSEHIGAESRIPYSAEYLFYAAQ